MAIPAVLRMPSPPSVRRIARVVLVGWCLLAGATAPMAVRADEPPFYTAHVYPGGAVTLSEAALRAHDKKVIALTFDDGPDPINDPAILRLLASHKAVATFFVIGRDADGRLDQIKAMIAAGNEIGNHSWNHRMFARMPGDVQAAEMRRTDELLASAGISVHWFRPPYGSYTTETLSVAKGEGLETILWSADPSDWRNPRPATIARRVIRDIRPGAVILMHSTSSHTVSALPAILDHATANGFQFVTLSEWKRIMIEVDPANSATLAHAIQGGG